VTSGLAEYLAIKYADAIVPEVSGETETPVDQVVARKRGFVQVCQNRLGIPGFIQYDRVFSDFAYWDAFKMQIRSFPNKIQQLGKEDLADETVRLLHACIELLAKFQQMSKHYLKERYRDAIQKKMETKSNREEAAVDVSRFLRRTSVKGEEQIINFCKDIWRELKPIFTIHEGGIEPETVENVDEPGMSFIENKVRGWQFGKIKNPTPARSYYDPSLTEVQKDKIRQSYEEKEKLKRQIEQSNPEASTMEKNIQLEEQHEQLEKNKKDVQHAPSVYLNSLKQKFIPFIKARARELGTTLSKNDITDAFNLIQSDLIGFRYNPNIKPYRSIITEEINLVFESIWHTNKKLKELVNRPK